MRSPSDFSPEQLDLFDPPMLLPPNFCGRGLGPCKAIVEPDQIRCLTCGCVAPRASRNDTPKGTIFDGFIQSQLKFMKFLREQEPRREFRQLTGELK
jgi:hypothetical protein